MYLNLLMHSMPNEVLAYNAFKQQIWNTNIAYSKGSLSLTLCMSHSERVTL